MLNCCADDCPSLADSADLREGTEHTPDPCGRSMASVRFIRGMREAHEALEPPLVTQFSTAPASMQWRAIRDTLRGEGGSMIGVTSDELKHASIIDAAALQGPALPGCQPRYGRSRAEAKDCRFRLLATGGADCCGWAGAAGLSHNRFAGVKLAPNAAARPCNFAAQRVMAARSVLLAPQPRRPPHIA